MKLLVSIQDYIHRNVHYILPHLLMKSKCKRLHKSKSFSPIPFIHQLPSKTPFKIKPSLHQQKKPTNETMSPSSLLSLFLPLLLLLSIADANVDETCKAAAASIYTIHYSFCTTSLRTDPKSETANPKDLGLIGTQLCLTNATNTSTKINDMIKNGNFSHKVKEILQLCDGVYNNQIDLLNGAMDPFKKGDYGDAMVKFGRVKERAYDCDDLFFEGGEEDLLKKDESDLAGLSVLALFLVGRLRGR